MFHSIRSRRSHLGTFDLQKRYLLELEAGLKGRQLSERDYTFNGLGRFVVLKIFDQSVLFELQADLTTSLWPATVNKRLAFGIPGCVTFQVFTAKIIMRTITRNKCF